MRRNGDTLLFLQQLRWNRGLRVGRIFDHHQLQPDANLWRGQTNTDAGERGEHVVDQTLDFVRGKLRLAEGARGLVEHRCARLLDAQA
jgi:hypothetical protein